MSETAKFKNKNNRWENVPDAEKELKKVLRAIHRYCLDCSGGDENYLIFCSAFECKIYKYRGGK